MAFGDVLKVRTGGFGSVGTTAKTGGLNTSTGLLEQARSAGLGKQAERILNPPKKLSTLQRIGSVLGAFNPAEALLTGIEKKSVLKGVGKYAKGLGVDIAEGISGRDIDKEERRTFSDVAEQAGIDNKILKFGIGFLGDVLLDPSTYFGGAIARGIGVGAKLGIKGVSKIKPIGKAIESISGALGKAFKYGFGTSKGLPEKALEIQSKLAKTKEGIVASNLARLGTDTLSKGQQEELVQKLLLGKRAELGQREIGKGLQESAKFFEPMQNRALRLLETREKDLSLLGTEINNLQKKGLKIALKPTKEAVLPRAVSKIKEVITPEELKLTAPKNFDGLTNSYAVKNVLQKEFKSFDLLQQEVKQGGWSRLIDVGIDKNTAESVAKQIFKSPIYKPAETLLELIPPNVSSKETRQLVESLVRLPKEELEKVKRLIGTREGWKKGLMEEVEGLQKEWVRFDELQQGELRLAEKILAQKGQVARSVAQSADPLIQKTIGEQATRSQKFAKQAGIKDPYEIYFPGLKNDSIKKFFEGTKVLKVGSQGYLKQFRNLLTDDELIKNPATAFAKREFDIAKDGIVKGELASAIRQYGKPLEAFKSTDDAIKAGYKVVKEKGIFGKEVGYLKEIDKKFLDNLISPEFTSIDMIAKATGFDALTSLFKRSVTGLFPAFHVRNFVSGHIQNFETLGIGALNPVNISNGQKMAWRLAQNDKGLFTGQFGKEMKAFADRFGTSSSYIADIADATRGAGTLPGKILSKESLKETAKTVGLGQQAIPFRTARAIGNFIETQQKATAYLTALGQGKTIKEALELATRAGFDYRALTGFESKIMRRLIPFYSFTRKNIELQLRTLGENPQRINQVIKLMDNIAGDVSKEEKEALPDYTKEGFTVKTGVSETGMPEIAAGFGTPLEAFTGLFGFADKSTIEKQLSTLNNIIKAPLERAVGRDFFRDRPLGEVVEANEYSKMPQFIKDFLEIREVKSKDFKTGKEKVKYTGNPYKIHLLRQLPTTRGVSTLYNIYNEKVTPGSRLLYGLTGIKPRPIDLETEKYFKDKKQQDALEDLLLRSGIIKKFENVYIPKEKKGGFGGD